MARSREAILRDMLYVASEKVNKTTLMYRASLSYPQLVEHLNYLIERQMIINSDGLYVTSEKGRAFIHAYQKMQEIITK